MAQNKPVRVTRTWMLKLADSIYNTKTRSFLMLCNGTLQNGPHPKTGKPMHCGLGELYFAMTGHQPEEDGVSESDVINACVERSPLEGGVERRVAEIRKGIKALGLPVDAEDQMLDTLDNQVEEAENFESGDCDEDAGTHEFTPDAERAFREALNEIPSKNDKDGCEEGTCDYDTYRGRASRVATQLRRAAKHLPG